MGRSIHFILTIVVILLISVFYTPNICAKPQLSQHREGYFFLQRSVFSRHWKDNYRYNNKQELLGLEYQLTDSKLIGLTKFKNSFNQSCWYSYIGRSYLLWDISSQTKVYGKMTVGFISGYDDENGRYNGIYNRLKTFPVIVPGFELEYKKIFIFDLVFYASSGFMITTGVKF